MVREDMRQPPSLHHGAANELEQGQRIYIEEAGCDSPLST